MDGAGKLEDHGADTCKIQIAEAINHGEPIKPFASNIIERASRLDDPRASSGLTEDEALADAESACRGAFRRVILGRVVLFRRR